MASIAGCGGGDGGSSTSPPPSLAPPAAPELVVLAGNFGGPGSRDAIRSDARFYSPFGVSVDALGRVYVTDGDNHTVRRIETDGRVVTIAGYRTANGYMDGSGAVAQFDRPSGIATAPDGSQYVVDSWNNRIRRVTPDGVVTTIAGGAIGSADGPVATASFSFCALFPPFPPYGTELGCSPSGIAADRAGTLYVADTYNNVIRTITPTGVVSTLAGAAGVPGIADGPAAQARFNWPSGVAVDGTGTVYVADTVNSTIRKISPSGEVTTLAGEPRTTGTSDGQGSAARFTLPMAITVDTSGHLYVADSGNYTVRKISPSGVVSTLAGVAGLSGSGDGGGTATCCPGRFAAIGSVALDAAGNLYVADRGNHTIRRVAPDGGVTTVAGLAQSSGHVDADGILARFSLPRGVAADDQGNVFVADAGNHAIRKVDLAGRVSTFAGRPGIPGSADGGPGDNRFHFPADVAIAGSGDLYVADSDNHVIRKITAAGVASTFAGSAGAPGSADGSGGTARFWRPTGIALDRAGNVYVADSSNSSIRKITAGGIVTTLAGSSGVPGYADAAGSNARFNFPTALAVDDNGVVYVVDANNNRIRRIAPDGVVTTFAGTGGTGAQDGPASAATFGICAIRIVPDPQSPQRVSICNGRGITVDERGDVYVADTYNQSIRRISADGVVSTVFSFRSWFGHPPATLDYTVEAPADLVFVGNRLVVTAYEGLAAVLNLK
jgi:sugar lactone lactonase YvrE